MIFKFKCRISCFIKSINVTNPIRRKRIEESLSSSSSFAHSSQSSLIILRSVFLSFQHFIAVCLQSSKSYCRLHCIAVSRLLLLNIFASFATYASIELLRNEKIKLYSEILLK